jgi:hypothetical protein
MIHIIIEVLRVIFIIKVGKVISQLKHGQKLKNSVLDSLLSTYLLIAPSSANASANTSGNINNSNAC